MALTAKIIRALSQKATSANACVRVVSVDMPPIMLLQLGVLSLFISEAH